MLPIGCSSGRLVLEIRDVVGGEPGPNVLARGRIRAERVPDLGATFQFFRIGGGGLFLMAGDQIALVLDNPTGLCAIFRGPEGDSYSAGEGFFEALPNPPGWVPFSETETRLDLPFMTVVRVP
jgi:SAM-dependent methyltransferase